MALINNPDTDVAAAAAEVRMQMTMMVRDVQRAMREVQRLVEGRKADVAAALGTDAADLAALYAKGKALVVAAGETVEDLPA
jgi:phosphosulfolactate phosphohydrolase-like enzyme